MIFAQISPEIHGLVVFLGDKVFVRTEEHNLKALLILLRSLINVNIADDVIKIGQG